MPAETMSHSAHAKTVVLMAGESTAGPRQDQCNSLAAEYAVGRGNYRAPWWFLRRSRRDRLTPAANQFASMYTTTIARIPAAVNVVPATNRIAGSARIAANA